MGKGLVLLLTTLGIGTAALGQTSTDLNAKYREITSYELRPDSIMTPKYATDGQVCEIAIERRQNTGAAIVFASPFSENEVSQFVDELAPEAERGRNLTRALNEDIDGDFITTTYTYENILVRVHGLTRPAPGGSRVIIITWPKRTCSGGHDSSVDKAAEPMTRDLRSVTPVVPSSKAKH
jgi:hypothetical protein